MTIVKEKKFRYKGYSFRLDDRTYKKLKELKEKEGISWNRLFYKLIKNIKD
jgi:hypothetical protein